MVRLVRETDVAYATIGEGMAVARGVTEAAPTRLGGGWFRLEPGGGLAGWTLKYDEVIFVTEGQVEVVSAEGVATARAGEALLISEGTEVSYRSPDGASGVYVLSPRDWAAGQT